MALNPELLDVLRREYGKVTVTSAGQWGDWHVVEKPRENGRGINRLYRVQDNGSRGEQYVLNCPFCNDDRMRFRVSHMFGRKDPKTGRPIRVGLHCFNEDCHEQSWARDELWEVVDRGFASDARLADLAGDEYEVTIPETLEIAKPGLCESLSSAFQRSTRDPVVSYLLDRGFDLQYLEEYYGVMVLRRGYNWRMLDNRVFVPFYRDGHLVAWTARAIDQDTHRKYCNSSGNLGGMLYGLRSAISHEVMVAVEGPMDRWGVGDASFAVLSKSFGAAKQARMQMAMTSPMCKVELVVSLFDPVQPENERLKGKTHQLIDMANRMRELTGRPSIPIAMPQWLDGGAADGMFLANYLERQLINVGERRLAKILSGSVRRSSATVQRL